MKRDAMAPARGPAAGGRSRLGLTFLMLLCALCAGLVLSTAASAAPVPDPTNPTFDCSGTPAGSCSNTKVAVDESSGFVYVLDTAHQVVDVFDSTGVYQSQLTVPGGFSFGGEDDIAIDNSGGPNQGNVYVIEENAPAQLFAFDASGTALWQTGGFGDPCGVGVDSSGRLWSSDFNTGVQQHSIANGSAFGPLFAADHATSPFFVATSCEIAFDSANTLYVNSWHADIWKYLVADYTTASSTVDSTPNFDVATDTSTNDLYSVNQSSQISVRDSTGTAATPFDTGSSGLRGVTVDGSHGRIYVSDPANSRLQIFDRNSGTSEPYVRKGPAISVTTTGAMLTGLVNPAGASTTCQFEYVSDTQFAVNGFASASTQACASPPGSGTSNVFASGTVSGLSAGVTYHFRLLATNSTGTTNGAASTFTTPSPPVLTTGNATGVTQTGAMLHGTVNPKSASTTCEFQYVDDAQFGIDAFASASTQACSSDPGSGTTDVNVDATLSGLTAKTTYHYRLVATNANGPTNGSGDTFTTLPDPPVVTTNAASSLTQTTATLNGSVNPNGASTACHFEYGATTSYGSTIPCASAPGSGSSAVPVSAVLASLTANATYHYRLVATNSGGTTNGTDQTLTTLIDPPAVTTGDASGITQTAAGLAGSVNPKGGSTSCKFEYGTTTAYGSEAPCASAPGSGSSAVNVSALLSGLTPSTTYHYRLVATNSSGTTNGADKTFTTATPPPPPPPPTGGGTPQAGTPSLSKTAKVSGGVASIALACKGDAGATCKGTLTFTAKVKVKVKKGKKTKTKTETIAVGKVFYDLGAGKSTTLKLKLSAAAKKALNTGSLLATAKGLKGSIKLPKTVVKKKHKKKHKK